MFIQALAPMALTLLAMLLQPALPQDQTLQLAFASILALVWLGFILSATSGSHLRFYLLNWFLMLIFLLLRIKINTEGVIRLPAVYNWLSSLILIPFHGLVNGQGELQQWPLASLLGSLFCLLILLRLGWLHRRRDKSPEDPASGSKKP